MKIPDKRKPGAKLVYKFDKLNKPNTKLVVGDYDEKKRRSVYTSAVKWAERQGMNATFTTRNVDGKLVIYRVA